MVVEHINTGLMIVNSLIKSLPSVAYKRHAEHTNSILNGMVFVFSDNWNPIAMARNICS
jgi:hypothetical protein